MSASGEGGVLPPGGSASRKGGGCLSGRGVLHPGVCIQGGLHLHEEDGLHRGGGGYYGIRSTSGRYTSYWNTFLLFYMFSPFRTVSRLECDHGRT